MTSNTKDETSFATIRDTTSTPEGTQSTLQEPKDKVDSESSAIERLRNLQDAVLQFLAHASNETLGACAVGLCASTYLVLGRIGLVLIGAVGGIVLHATWEGNNLTGSDGKIADASLRRKELGVDILKRTLDWRDSQNASKQVETTNTGDKIEASTLSKALDFSGFRPATGAALTAFTDAVIRDYVRYWYKPILPKDDSFPNSCRQVLAGFIISFSNHLSRKRTADPFLDFLANSTSIVIVFLNELSTALKASQRQDVSDALNTYLQYQPDSNLANVTSKAQQERKLKLVADDVLQNFLDSKTYNCAPTKTFLTEVLAGLVLSTAVDSCSKPEWINGWIVYLLEDGEPELMNVIDAGVEDMASNVSDASARLPQRGVHQRRMSKAEEAMQQAMFEAQRLNAMIAEDDASRKQGAQHTESEDTASTTTTTTTTTTDAGMATPSSSESERYAREEPSREMLMVFDSEGNALPSTAPSPSRTPASSPFTNFDQLGSLASPTALSNQSLAGQMTSIEVAVPLPLTLLNASVTIMDLGESNDRLPMYQKPTSEMMIQIEPASSKFPGWMVTQIYANFEPLHETLRRIAIVSGVPEFANQYMTAPAWKGQTRANLISELERYLRQALRSERLAESEAMKKFLDKETGQGKAPTQNKNVLLQGSAALENVGKNFVNVLGQGGKGIQTGFQSGGKAVLGGVQGVFGAVTTGIGGPKRPSNSRTQSSSRPILPARPSQDLIPSDSDWKESRIENSELARRSLEQGRSNSPRMPQMTSARNSHDGLNIHLPPTPSEISDRFEPPVLPSPRPLQGRMQPQIQPTSRSSLPKDNSESRRQLTPENSERRKHLNQGHSTPTGSPENVVNQSPQKTEPMNSNPGSQGQGQGQKRRHNNDTPVTEEETRVAVELMFAVITEMFSLSSAWTIRLSLLSAAKTFLLRPNNPQLESIRALIQESVLDANFGSDTGMAAHIEKLRENSLPTEEELAKWPKEMSPDEKEKLRVKARKLLVERGMPQALTSVMGAAASGEALGRVFDCFQVESIARGLVFALMLQAIRAVTQ